MELTPQKNYWVVRLGEGNKFAEVAYRMGCIAIGWSELDIDLSKHANLDQKAFTETLGRMLAKVYKDKSEKYISGTARQLYKFAVLMKPGDVVMSPAGSDGIRYIGIIQGGYRHTEHDAKFPYRHRRDVKWIAKIDKSKFSEELRNSTGAMMTVFNISKHAAEIERLMSGGEQYIAGQDIESVEDFGLESHLEDFLIENWDKLDLGKNYDVYTEEGEIVGQQYPTDVGRIDILAKSKTSKEWLVIELKKGRSGDAVVGQLLRYMGYVKKHMAQDDESIRGLIMAGEDEKNIRYAISNLPDVEFMTYSVQFKLNKVDK